MKHKSKLITIISIVFVLLWMLGAGLKFMDPPRLCVDGIEYDEQKLKDICGVLNKQDYFDKKKINPNFCPNDYQTYHMVGGCTPQYGLAVVELILPTIIWFGVLGAILLFVGFYKKKPQK